MAVDANAVVGEYLATQTAVTSLLGTNQGGSIYYGSSLPEHFDPALGPAIQIYRMGGESHAEITPLSDVRVMVRVWTAPEDAGLAAQVYGAISDVLHGVCGASVSTGTIVCAQEGSGPFDMPPDPDTAWVAVYAIYKVTVRPNSGAFNGPGQTSFIGGLTRYSNISTPPTLVQVGSSATWTLSVAFTADAMVFRNGELLAPGADNDYTTSGNSITFAIAPSPGDNLIVME